MNWMLMLHIATMLCWCGALLYLPALISDTVTHGQNHGEAENAALPDKIFRLILTPAALIAIVSGSAVFIGMHLLTTWLILKLTLVVGLIICHVFNGLLIVHRNDMPLKRLNQLCLLAGTVSLLLIISIFWLVLAKPYPEILIW